MGRFDASLPEVRRSTRAGAVRRRSARAIAVAAWLLAFPAFADPTLHTVYEGQRLGSIARRYNVTVEAICHASGISPTAAIRPGQQLVIPERSDEDGSAARAWREAKERGARPSATPSRAAGAASAASATKPPATDELKYHTVAKGHTLTAISRRYGVSVAAIAYANSMAETDPLEVGERLAIPPKDDADGSKTRLALERATKASRKKASASDDGGSASPSDVVTHQVAAGQSLGAIAARYGTSVDALCAANGIDAAKPLQIGQTLHVPPKTDPDGTRTAALRTAGRLGPADGSDTSWRAYSKPPWKAGYVHLKTYSGEWKGYVIGPGDKVLPAAIEKVAILMGATGEHPSPDERLVRLIAEVSDTFGGRPMMIVSGYRETSYAADSKHRHSRAIDFRVEGVPNEALRAYLLTLDRVGVGYYPNSSFVHLDVRDAKASWIDLAGPGDAPQYVRATP